MSRAHSDLHVSQPTRDDWRAALAEWADPVTGAPPEHLPDPLPEDLMDALGTFQKVDDHSPPASELEVVSIVRAVHHSEIERDRRETASGWRLLAAVLAAACLGLLFWLWTDGDRSRAELAPADTVLAATSIVELRAGVTRSASPTHVHELPRSDFVVVISPPGRLDHPSRWTLELVSGPETLGRLPVRLDDGGWINAQIRRDLLPDGPLTLHLRDPTDEAPVATWTLVPADWRDEPPP
ncbi:MAG: hypothetical protein AAGE94_02025 [Acidobacteriota bacterium]